jgi:hypothetical protein
MVKLSFSVWIMDYQPVKFDLDGWGWVVNSSASFAMNRAFARAAASGSRGGVGRN